MSWQHVNLFCKHDVMLQCMVGCHSRINVGGELLIFFLFCFVLWPANAKLFHKLSHSYMFRHYRVIFRELVINTLPSYTNISNAAVGIYYQQLHLKYSKFTIKMYHIFFLIITNSCIWNICVTWQGIDYKLPEDDTIVSKHVGVW